MIRVRGYLQPARTAPPVVESLSFLHRAPSPDARRVLVRHTVGIGGRRPPPSGGPVRSDPEESKLYAEHQTRIVAGTTRITR